MVVVTENVPAVPRVRLRDAPSLPPRVPLSAEQLAVVRHTGGRLRVLAGPGTGKTATLVEAVAERIHDRGVAPENVLVLTFSRRAARELTERITRRLALTTREPMVRTLHSYAYSLLRARAARQGEPSPRLLQAGESDLMVRELLQGQREDGREEWPPWLRGAVGTPAFAAELRDLLLRTAERGITPGRLAEWGRRRRRPEWVAAARFAVEYQDVADLRQGSSGFGAALDQAELTGAALALLSDPLLLAQEQARVRRVFVDEYQDVDPAQARLVAAISSAADEFVVFGDPDQSIYAFRGAEPAALRDLTVDRTVHLTRTYRLPSGIAAAARRVSARLPGHSGHRALDAVGGKPPADPVVRVLSTPAQEAAFVADELRRAHLREGLPWPSMAVLSRSPAANLPTIRRAFAAAGIPVALPAGSQRLAEDPVVSALISVLDIGRHPARLTGDVALELLASPLAELSLAQVRRLRRHLRRAHPGEGSSADLVAGLLAGASVPDDLPEDLASPVLRVRDMVALAAEGAHQPSGEDVLWQLWQRSQLGDRYLAASLRGGRAAQQADAALDAVLGLFGLAADLAERLPHAGVGAVVDAVNGQRIAADPTARERRAATGVAVLSAHAAKGLEWDVVAVVGVTEGRWPVLHSAPSMLGVSEAIDAAMGVPTGTEPPDRLDDERRLFYVAVTRARRRLVVTAHVDQDTVASRFLTELAGSEDIPAGWPEGAGQRGRRGLRLPDLVADLRRAVTDPATSPERARAAAEHLATLALAGVPGAHPQDWYGLSELSTDRAPLPAHAPLTVSPSAVEAAISCPLRGVLERRGGRGRMEQPQIDGIVVHALVDGLARGLTREDLTVELDRFLDGRTGQAAWMRARNRRALLAMLDAAVIWHTENRIHRQTVGSEVPLRVAVPPAAEAADHAVDPSSVDQQSDAPDAAPTDSERTVWLTGRIDRLERRPDGRLVIVDFKTAATKITKAQAVDHPQLAVYQVALELGAFDDLLADGPTGSAAPLPDGTAPAGPAVDELSPPARPGPARSGGAELVYLRSGRPQVLEQPPIDDERGAVWRAAIRAAAQTLAAASLPAIENARCDRCPVRGSCPLRPEGRQVTR